MAKLAKSFTIKWIYLSKSELYVTLYICNVAHRCAIRLKFGGKFLTYSARRESQHLFYNQRKSTFVLPQVSNNCCRYQNLTYNKVYITKKHCINFINTCINFTIRHLNGAHSILDKKNSLAFRESFTFPAMLMTIFVRVSQVFPFIYVLHELLGNSKRFISQELLKTTEIPTNFFL